MARTAEVKRDARIGEADAKRDAQIKEAIAEEERMAARYGGWPLTHFFGDFYSHSTMSQFGKLFTFYNSPSSKESL